MKKIELIEATVKNTSITLRCVATSKNYKLTLLIPKKISIEKQKLLLDLGSSLTLIDSQYGMKDTIYKFEDIVSHNFKNYLILKQFKNIANPEIYYNTTGPEIWSSKNGNMDILISILAKKRTITGVIKHIKQNKNKKKLISMTVKPTESPVITQFLSEKKIKSGLYKIQEIRTRFIPKNIKSKLINQVITTSNKELIYTAKKSMKKERILLGILSRTFLYTVLKI